MKIAVLGSRGYLHLHKIKYYISTIPEGFTVVSGGYRGVDSYACKCAKKKGLQIIVFNRKWDRYKKNAESKHMSDILSSSDHVVVFWDGKSKGSKAIIDMARKTGKSLQVIL